MTTSNRELYPGICASCGCDVDERCQDGYCRSCHVSCSWEACLDGTWANEFRIASGLPPIEPRANDESPADLSIDGAKR